MNTPFARQVEQAIEAKLAAKPRPLALVIDDDSNDTLLIQNALAEENCNTVVSHDGESAVALMRQFTSRPFDIIFLDLKLPTLSGVDTLRTAHDLLPATPCVIITGHPSSDSIEQAAALGYVELAIKPLSKDTVARIFRTHKIKQ